MFTSHAEALLLVLLLVASSQGSARPDAIESAPMGSFDSLGATWPSPFAFASMRMGVYQPVREHQPAFAFSGDSGAPVNGSYQALLSIFHYPSDSAVSIAGTIFVNDPATENPANPVISFADGLQLPALPCHRADGRYITTVGSSGLGCNVFRMTEAAREFEAGMKKHGRATVTWRVDNVTALVFDVVPL